MQELEVLLVTLGHSIGAGPGHSTHTSTSSTPSSTNTGRASSNGSRSSGSRAGHTNQGASAALPGTNSQTGPADPATAGPGSYGRSLGGPGPGPGAGILPPDHWLIPATAQLPPAALSQLLDANSHVSRCVGCVVGKMCGNALGACVEGCSWDRLVQLFPGGLTEFQVTPDIG